MLFTFTSSFIKFINSNLAFVLEYNKQMLEFDSPLSSVRGIGPRFIQKFKQLGINTVGELLCHFPVRYEDFSDVVKISEISPGEKCTVRGIVKKTSVRRAWRKRMFLVESEIEDGSGKIRAVWFNQTYIQNSMGVGKVVNLSGAPSAERKSGQLYFSNPSYEIISGNTAARAKHTARIVPIYPETKGLTSRGIRYVIKPILESVKIPEEIIPEKIMSKHGLMGLAPSLRLIHFPNSISDAEKARRRFSFEELFILELRLLGERAKNVKNNAYKIDIDINLLKSLTAGLPFKLTMSQKKALWEISKDMSRSYPMNRLLQGDVGSGKTIVAALAGICAANGGFQTAFMAPTEILARQHYETLKKTFPNFDGGIALVTGSGAKIYYARELETHADKNTVKREIEKGGVKIVVGTHALIAKKRTGENGITFKKLALVIVDEQHRFGVKQRALLLGRGDTGGGKTSAERQIPHFLSMSATPIPRTLSLALWSNLDFSSITEMPKNRKPIDTRVVEPRERPAAYAFIRNEIARGRQAFVVCPRIEPATNDEQLTTKELYELIVKSVKEEYEKLSKKIFPGLFVAMLHGRMKAEEKEKIMRDFSLNKTNILVTTSVIEVGVDVPNATIMFIEGAERFGLAQLYQFRGRVGRGEHKSYCFLFSDSASKDIEKRLLSVAKAKNGLELAESDLKIRGPGEFLGDEQTGMPDLAMKALKNPALVEEALEAAKEIINEYESLSNYPELKKRVEKFGEKVHME